jgi:hypothetical protein
VTSGERGRAWLGGEGSEEGSERLARLFQIGRTERTLQAEEELAELMARVPSILESKEFAIRYSRSLRKNVVTGFADVWSLAYARRLA